MSPLTLSSHRHQVLIGGLAGGGAMLGRSDHFTVYRLSADADPDDILVVHDFLPEQIDNDIGAYVSEELLPLLARARPGSPSSADGCAYSEQETFERYVGAIVRSIDGNERRAWHRFYDNTLAALRRPVAVGAADNGGVTPDFIASFRAIYGRVRALVSEVSAASVLDVATCFGFLPLWLAGEAEGAAFCITGCDLNPALTALAEDYRRQRGLERVRFVCADILAEDAARRLAPAGRAFDVVAAIHLLEHLSPDEGSRAMETLWALARRRLIVAVPFEAEPDARFGHCRTFDRASLGALAAPLGGRSRSFEHHGGWLVVDRERENHGRREMSQ